MNPEEEFSNSTYADRMHLAERELASFISAVTELFGPEQARLSADDWLDESESMDSPPRSTSRDWRAVTVAASARLANRLTVARDHRNDRKCATKEKREKPTMTVETLQLNWRWFNVTRLVAIAFGLLLMAGSSYPKPLRRRSS